MTFLMPWAMALGVAGALGLVALHLIARRKPAAYALPTARFIPDRDTLVSRAASRPSDLLLLLLRVLLLLAAAAAFARPVVRARSQSLARVMLVDRTGAAADPHEADERIRALGGEGVTTQVVAFDSTLSAGLVAARRAASVLGRDADSVELVLVSPVTANELDAATDSVRAQWPGAIRVVRLSAGAPDDAWPLHRPVATSDVLGPALASRRVAETAHHVRLGRGPLDAADSAAARAGAAVVRWDSAGAPATAEGIASGGEAVVALLGRGVLPSGGRAIARWADGAPAAVEAAVGAGCIRTVGAIIPTAGDLPLRSGFQRFVRRITSPCGAAHAPAADSVAVARLARGGAMARGDALASGERTSRVVPWLLAFALLCALGELVVRVR